MKIAIIYPHARIPSPPTKLFDAVSIVVHEHARRLARHHDVTVFLGQEKGTPRSERHEGVHYLRMPLLADRAINRLKVLDRFKRPDRPFRTTAAYYAPFAMRVARVLAKERYDVVHLHSVVNFLPRLRRALPEARLIAHIHDHSMRDFDGPSAEARLRHADLVLACSEHVIDKVRQRFPALAGRCVALHNGFDERFGSVRADPAAGRRILFCGRLVPEKGVHVLLSAVARLKERFSDLQLELVGPVDMSPPEFVDCFRDDPPLADVRSLLADRAAWEGHLRGLAEPLGDKVQLAGPVPHADLAERYAAANVFAFPSAWREPFGMPVAEAMATGLPVVATRGGAIGEILEEGRSGLLVERGDALGLADALGRLLDDADLRVRMGTAGRARAARHFDWDSVVARMLRLYEGSADEAETGVQACVASS